MLELNTKYPRARTSTVQRGRLSKLQQHIFNHKDKDPDIYLELTNNITINNAYLQQLFGNSNPIILDLGFGDGNQLLELAINLPKYNFIGIELYRKGIANILKNIKSQQINNVRIMYGDCTAILPSFADHIFYKIQVFFPDPWPKIRHHNRRLLQESFIQIIKYKLEQYGILHVITDVNNYANSVSGIIDKIPEFSPYNQHNLFRPITKFEKLAKAKGNSTYELVFILQSIE